MWVGEGSLLMTTRAALAVMQHINVVRLPRFKISNHPCV